MSFCRLKRKFISDFEVFLLFSIPFFVCFIAMAVLCLKGIKHVSNLNYKLSIITLKSFLERPRTSKVDDGVFGVCVVLFISSNIHFLLSSKADFRNFFWFSVRIFFHGHIFPLRHFSNGTSRQQNG